MKIAFYVRNEFQFRQFLRLFSSFEEAVWLANGPRMLRYIRRQHPAPAYLYGAIRRIAPDFLFLQGGLDNIAVPPGCIVGMLQYSYAKSRYTYGLWRGAADIVYAYGPAGANAFGKLARSESVGNPRWDDFLDPDFRRGAQFRFGRTLREGLPTIVYAPTWGDLSSSPQWLSDVERLCAHYNVLVKAHHNQRDRGLARTGPVSGGGVLDYVPDADLFELLVVADVVVSDYSGAIFDALLCEKPIVALDIPAARLAGSRKIDPASPEVFDRERLGWVVRDPGELRPCIEAALNSQDRKIGLRAEYFEVTPGVCDRIRASVHALVESGQTDAVDVGPRGTSIKSDLRNLYRKLQATRRLSTFSLVANAILLAALAAALALGR